MRTRTLSLCVLACAAFFYTGTQTNAALVTLTDLNSSVQIETDAQKGMFVWSVDGVDHLCQQWFWYRIGDQGPETSIDALGPAAVSQVTPRYVTTLYTAAGAFSIQVDYLLTGGTAGSRTSDIAESIRFINLSGGVLPLRFFQYVNFDLNGVPGGDYAQLVNANTMAQWKPGVVLTETESVDTPAGKYYDVAYFPQTLNELNDQLPTTLHNVAGPIGPGDVTWALEWVCDIPVGGTVLISKDKRITPEPMTLALLALGGLSLRRGRR